MSSLITRCPVCETMFKVVPDQLRVSDGWVRCGQCNEVFDANSHLQNRTDAMAPAPVTALQTRVEPQPAPEPAPVPPPPVAVPPPEVKIEQKRAIAVGPRTDSPQTVDAPSADLAPASDESFLVVNPRALHIDPEPEAVVQHWPATLGEQRGVPIACDDKTPRASKEATVTPESEPPKHSFMKLGHSSETPHRPWMRRTGWATCVLLIAVLMVQVLVQERDRIVATEPYALRVLGPLCEALACQVSPLRQIESIVIDSSAFTKLRSDVFRLSFTLKNTAQTPVATPSMELTLTDLQDQAVVRRVFSPADFGRQPPVLEPGAELVASIPVAVKSGAGNVKISGYRLLSFYP